MDKVDTSIFNREITHKTYPKERKKYRFLDGSLPFEIQRPLYNTVTKKHIGKIGNEDAHNYIDHNFIAYTHPSKMAPLIFGGVSLILVISFFF